jgi:hypothetical protein
MNPTTTEKDATVTGSLQELLPKHSADVLQNFRITSRVEAMATEINTNPGNFEASRIAPHEIILL